MFFEKRIMSSQEQEVILDWMLEVQHKFVSNPMGNHRNYYIFSDDPSAPKVLFDIKKRIYKKEKLGEVYIEPMYKDYIGCILEGGHIHKHKDANVGNLKHVRYNVFLTVPKKGGVPFYNDKKMKMVERGYIKCNSGDEYHYCTPVEGEIPRIVISYGFLV